MSSPSHYSAILIAAALIGTNSLPASASCTRLAFSVNDYGKEGPTNDAKSLLDKYIAKWSGEHGIAKYTTGKKDVSCELFLNFIVFDEHTCRAEATVCWDGPPVAGAVTTATGPDKPATSNALKRAAAPVLPVKAKQAAVEPQSPATPVETGTLPATTAATVPASVAAAPAAESPPAASPPAVPAAVLPIAAPAAAMVPATGPSAVADQALAAAKRAADAAERAAVAAERAAAAAAATEKKSAATAKP